jgi:glycosyltransferase involved in cell wall biosynthesis
MSHKLLFLDQFGTLGGGQRVLLETLNSLDRAQYQTMVALVTRGDFRERLLDEGIPVMDLPLGNYHSGKKTLLDVVRFFFRSLHCASVLTGWVLRHRPSLLFANAPRTFICATLAGWLTQRPVIWHLHNVLPKGVELSLLAVFARWVHTIVVCSQAAADPLLERRPNLQSKIRLIYNPVPRLKRSPPGDVDRLRESFGVQPDQVCLGILGRVTAFKGQWHFLQAARLVLQQEQEARFFVIGSPAADKSDQEYYSQLRLIVEQSGMKNSVFFVEYQREIENFIAMMDVVVVASQGPEALPQTVIEAMSMSKAVIAPPSGGIVEIVEDGKTGLFADVSEPSKLAAMMLKLIHDPDILKSLGRSAQERISRHHSREKFGEAIQSTLRSCLTQEGLQRVPASPEAA